MNSFLALEEEEIQRFVIERQDAVRETVAAKVSTHQFIGDVVELFFPRLADTVTVMLGGDVLDHTPSYLTVNADLPDDASDQTSPGPSDRDEIIR